MKNSSTKATVAVSHPGIRRPQRRKQQRLAVPRTPLCLASKLGHLKSLNKRSFLRLLTKSYSTSRTGRQIL